MIIFKCDENIKKCVEALDDRNLNMSIMMVAQALSSACFLLGIHTNAMYRVQHADHIIPQWAALSRNNYIWLYRYGMAACAEYTRRYNLKQPHGSKIIIEVCWLHFKANPLRPIRRSSTPFPNITEYKDMDVVEAYRKDLCEREWRSKAVWTATHAPAWFYVKVQKRG